MHQRALFEVKNRKNSQWTLPVCTGMYVQVCMYRYVYMYVRTCMYVHACMYMYVNTRTGMHMNVCGCVRTGMKVYKHKLHTLLGIALHIHIRNTDTSRYIHLITDRQTYTLTYSTYKHTVFVSYFIHKFEQWIYYVRSLIKIVGKWRYLARGSVTNHRRATM